MATVALAVAGLLGGCSSAHPRSAAPTTTLPPGAVTVDRWSPPVLSGPPSAANFCVALTALYRHMADLPHAADRAVGARIVSDYVAYAPTVVAEAPPAIRPGAATYLTTVAGYLSALDRAGLDMARLPPGTLASLTAPPVRVAATAVLGYSQSQCHYTIGAA